MSKLTTPEFRVSYPNVFKAKMNTKSEKLEYSLVALFKKGEDLQVLKAAAQEACEEKWGKDKAKWPKNLRSPFRDQADREKTEDDGRTYMPEGYVKGAIYFNLKNTQKPGVVDQSLQPIIEENEFYAGCYARATLSCYAYDNMGNAGVNFGLRNVQKTRDGDPLGNRTKAEDDFAPIEQQEASADLSQGGDSTADIFG